MSAADRGRGKDAAWHALAVTLAMWGLYLYWFVFAERARVFLYGHLSAAPFDAVTSGRYLMAGLVAAGLILGVRTLLLWTMRLWLRHRGAPWTTPDWRRIWTWSAAPVALGIGIITMGLGEPTLAWPLALGSAALALAGLALALWASNLASADPLEATWLAADGAALAAPLLLLHALELPAQGLTTPAVAHMAAWGSVAAAIVWLAIMTALRRHWRRPMPDAGELLAAGFSGAYLALPVAHLLLATPPGYPYITNQPELHGR